MREAGHVPSQNVRFGSLADILRGLRKVRFTPKSGHWLNSRATSCADLGAFNLL